jgi:hypothetical protein
MEWNVWLHSQNYEIREGDGGFPNQSKAVSFLVLPNLNFSAEMAVFNCEPQLSLGL